MIGHEVGLNGKRVWLVGADDLSVLSAHVTACGKLGSKTVPARPDDTAGELHYSVGGLTARSDPKKDVFMKWKSVEPLKTGDVIQVRFLETNKPDRARSTTKAERRKTKQSVQRTGASRSARKKNRTSSTAGSRR